MIPVVTVWLDPAGRTLIGTTKLEQTDIETNVVMIFLAQLKSLMMKLGIINIDLVVPEAAINELLILIMHAWPHSFPGCFLKLSSLTLMLLCLRVHLPGRTLAA